MARLLICVFLLTLAASIALGQGRVIDEATYTQVLESAGEYRLSENYRVKMITTVKSGPMTSEILEFEPPNKRRVRTFRIDRGELEPSSEWIFIEQTVYVKRQGLVGKSKSGGRLTWLSRDLRLQRSSIGTWELSPRDQ